MHLIDYSTVGPTAFCGRPAQCFLPLSHRNSHCFCFKKPKVLCLAMVAARHSLKTRNWTVGIVFFLFSVIPLHSPCFFLCVQIAVG